MLPYFFSVWHVIYTRYGLYYLRSMEGLPQHVLKCFMKVELVKGHIPGVAKLYGVSCSLSLCFMRYGHGKRSLHLKIWGFSFHICSRLEEDISLIISKENTEEQEKRQEEEKDRIQSDAKDKDSIRRKLDIYIESLDPVKASSNVCNLCEWPDSS